MFQVVHCSIVVFVVLQVIPLLLTVCYVSDNAVHCFRLLFFVFQVIPLFQTVVCRVFQVMPLFQTVVCCVSGDATVSDTCLSCVSGDAAICHADSGRFPRTAGSLCGLCLQCRPQVALALFNYSRVFVLFT